MKLSHKILLAAYADDRYRAALSGPHQETAIDRDATENYIKLNGDRRRLLEQCRVDLSSEYGKMVKEEIERRHA